MPFVLREEGTLIEIFDQDGQTLIPLYSLRGATQTLAPINGPAPRRTVNLVLYDVSVSGQHLYASEISCSDEQRVLAIDGIFPGAILTVHCAVELCYATGGTAQRPAVPDSEYEEGAFTFYRPLLRMMVMPGTPSQSFDEWGAVVGNKLSLEEVGTDSDDSDASF